MPILSVIIPVFQAELFLSRCIDSILSQGISDLEIILINDGSKDLSGKICDQYALDNPCITVIHQENKGVSAARNAGLCIAKGKYITFVDADDAVAEGTYQKMIEKASDTSAEIIGCGVQYYNEFGEYKRSDLLKEIDCNQEEMLSFLFDCPDPLGGSCCNKIFLAETLNGLRFDESVSMGEDWLFLFESFIRAHRLYKLADPLYCVTEHPNSSARKNDITVPIRILATSRRMTDRAKSYSFSLGSKAEYKYLDDCLRYIKQIRNIGKITLTPYRHIVFQYKCFMLKELLLALTQKRLSRSAFNGFLFGLFKS